MIHAKKMKNSNNAKQERPVVVEHLCLQCVVSADGAPDRTSEDPWRRRPRSACLHIRSCFAAGSSQANRSRDAAARRRSRRANRNPTSGCGDRSPISTSRSSATSTSVFCSSRNSTSSRIPIMALSASSGPSPTSNPRPVPSWFVGSSKASLPPAGWCAVEAHTHTCRNEGVLFRRQPAHVRRTHLRAVARH